MILETGNEKKEEVQECASFLVLGKIGGISGRKKSVKFMRFAP